MTSVTANRYEGTENEAFENDDVIELSDEPEKPTPSASGDNNTVDNTRGDHHTEGTMVTHETGNDETALNDDVIIIPPSDTGKRDEDTRDDSGGGDRNSDVDTILSGLETEINDSQSSTTDDVCTHVSLINPLDSVRYGWNYKCAISQNTAKTFYIKIAHGWMPRDPFGKKSTQKMICWQATSQYLNRCWSMTPYGVARIQSVNPLLIEQTWPSMTRQNLKQCFLKGNIRISFNSVHGGP